MSELADRPLRLSDEPVFLHWWRLLRWLLNLRMVPRWNEQFARLLTRVYRRFFYDGLTRVGKISLLCSMLIFLFSYRQGSDFLLLTAAFGMTLLLWSLLLGFVYRPRVTLQPDTPSTAVAGQPLISQIRVTNESRRGLYNFAIREMVVPYGRWPVEGSRPHQMALPTGQQTSVAVSFEPQKRGVLTLSGLAVQSYFPFFLTRFTVRVEAPRDVYVLPPTLPTSLPSLRHIAEQAGKRLTLGSDNSRKGPSLEYAFSRQYQTGDSLRRLDHRAGSRIGEPMSKVFEGSDEIRRDKVYLMVDLSLLSFERWQRRPRSETSLDRRLALAVELGLLAQNEGFRLVALATGREWHVLDNRLEFYRQIASCEPQRGDSGNSIPDTVLADDGLHIVVVGRWTDAVRNLVDRWQRAGILVLVFLLAESSDDTGTLPVGDQYLEIQPNEGTG
jgi:uncharacterized protein (DUF58 family)|tara:strand:+ start:11458 stop:12786 length:1329 start_codon:yes stop_codon:yes gene_type:complete